ncbi:hypothetical protein CHLNCDRAFT_143137 [Chlorella variabilis]|uniref:ER membrane protein complex subunit 2 n=1 Tax=Chlorella variabilis TaxID=554065 RepID=E1Z9J6_CHLVA|nr:hypothetical protein CHLNCDRAFT_143137 [Chlorella variabilis]EFN57788.1 hypothetical protein CHLNCDRAFT_143137 [Chlorella variabilis]|eukprot:XP_005849890.1 hypothetical protein CHLNCDRAFT_143137 [Chlorella variabilis]
MALQQLAARYPVRGTAPAPGSEPESTRERIQRLQQLMSAGNAASADGEYAAALATFDSVVRMFPDFATTEYARLSRALMLYQVGSSDAIRVSDAILQLEDLEVALRGYAEWEIAMEFNKSFSDRDWVYRTKHWPPRLMAALDRFLTLT